MHSIKFFYLFTLIINFNWLREEENIENFFFFFFKFKIKIKQQN